MEKINYDQLMENIIIVNETKGVIPTLLLHTCCAPCSSACLLRLTNYFQITVLYYNPNIAPIEEYEKRKQEQIRLIKEYPSKNKISFLDCDYEEQEFQKISEGLEDDLEGGERCHKCYALRLAKTAQLAKEKNFNYFGTSLTVSPYKNSQVLNEIGEHLERMYGVNYLYSDFKKHNGYQKSIELSVNYHLYRQDYCGCLFSKKEREKICKEKELY